MHLCFFFLTAVLGGASPSYVWIEAEDYAESNFSHFQASDMGKPELLSGGRWIMRAVQADEVAKIVPEEGVRLTYRFTAERGGAYRFWARVGWFRARAPLAWRLNDGPWREVPSDYPTRNLMELGYFCEASWADLGSVSLQPGANRLELRYPRPDGGRRMLIALDCLAFVRGLFTPEGGFRPDQTYDGPEDRAAAEQVFQLPEAEPGRRTSVTLNGLWQVARYDDPNMDAATYEPVRRLPDPAERQLRWMGFAVPGDPWKKPPLVFGHRLIYRTRVAVPRSLEGRGFTLHFSGTNWIVSVFVNGRLAGSHRGVWVPWDLDISPWIRPGQVNQIAVAVKGTYYALDKRAMGENQTLMALRNRPLDRKKWTRWVAPMYPSVKGDGDGYIYGIVNPVTLTAVGDVYVEDVFVKPSVRRRRLDVEATLRNTTGRQRVVTVAMQAAHELDGAVEWRAAPRRVTLQPREVRTVSLGASWPSPKLWWPEPRPHMYELQTVVRESDRTLDRHRQPFGFREVTIDGAGILINGVRRNFWNWVDVHLKHIDRPETWLEAWREENNRFLRFSHGRRLTQVLPTREQRLDFYDRHGVPGRLCTMIDGMFISFDLGRRTRDEQGRPVLVPNEPVWANFREHMAQVAKAYRNHPSVIFYQVENELVYINGMNIYGDYLDQIEQLMAEVVEAGRRLDPTRPYSVGGGGDLSGRLEINCPHYPHAALDYYPENAYTISAYATKIQRWPWDRSKPWVVGESCFANELAFGAYVAGDEAFRGIEAARRGKAQWLRMLYGGYRWAGVAGFFPWDNLWREEDARKIFSDLCVIPRKQTSRLYAGRDNQLLVKVMNDTLSDRPVRFQWSYEIDGRVIAEEDTLLDIPPGLGVERRLTIPAPACERRLEGWLRLRASQPGGKAPAFEDRRLTPVLPPARLDAVREPIFVLDRQGETLRLLQQAGAAPQRIGGLDELEGRSGLLVIGRDSLTAEEACGPRLLAFAAAGGRVVCLEQQTPLAGPALPAPLRTTPHFGGYAHPQALGTPLFADLGRRDLIDWAGDHPTYVNAYEKPSSGGRSLVECGPSLEYSALVELPCGRGVIVLCQLRVGAKLGRDPAADVLLRNLVRVYAAHRPAAGVAAVFSPQRPLLADAVQRTGLLAEPVAELREGLDANRYRVLVVDASAENLQQLLALRADADAFQQAGGWIMLNGLRPDGMDRFNQFVGADHLLRPFRIERVTLERPDHPLAATLGNRDLALLSPKPLLHGRYWVSGETYSYVIDGLDVAPFTLPPGAPDDPFVYEPTFDDHDPYNFVNGMLSSDFWRYIRQIWIPEEGPEPLTFRFRRPASVQTVKIWNNDIYWTIKDLDIMFDGDAASAVRVTLPDSAEPTTVRLPEPRRVKRTLTLQIRSWRERPTPRPGLRLVGVDNIQLLRPAPPSRGEPLDNVGGLVVFAHPRGGGGVLLNQLKFLKSEPRPENAAKKLRVLSVLLQNMGVGARSASAVLVPGWNLRYWPVNLQEHATAYLDDKSGKAGWFGRQGQNLEALPRGRHVLADVAYHIVDYATAPTPDCIILGGPGAPSAVRQAPERVEGVPVGRKADVLFFLHTAHVSRPITDRERRQMLDRRRPFTPPAVLTYVLHYADGQTAELPMVLGQAIDHWLQADPKPLPNARIAWSHPVAGASGLQATVYSVQAANPRPDVPIASIDVVRTSNRASPAVLAITCGEAVQRASHQ